MTMAKFSRARLARLHEVLAAHVERGEVPGLVALVSRHDEAHVEVLGQRTLDPPKPMSKDTLFRISSMTKPITAAAALIAIEECKLRLDDPVDRWLPELRDRRVLRRLDSALDDTVPAKRAISVRDLLTFRMGFGQMMARPEAYPILAAARERQLGMGPRPLEMPTPDEWLRRLGELPLMHQPGERWMYNTSSDVLGILLSRCFGRSLPALLEERLFQPLGMKDTSFAVPSSRLDRLATSYGSDVATGTMGVLDAAIDSQWGRPPAFPSGAGGLVSTLSDFFSFAQMLLRGGKRGGERILSQSAVELMTSDQLTPAQKAAGGLLPGDFDAMGWGFGLSVVTRREDFASLGSYGWDGGLGTTWSNDPRRDMIQILLTQRAWSSPRRPGVALDFATLAYQAIDD